MKLRRLPERLGDEIEAEGPTAWLWVGGGAVLLIVAVGLGVTRLLVG